LAATYKSFLKFVKLQIAALRLPGRNFFKNEKFPNVNIEKSRPLAGMVLAEPKKWRNLNPKTQGGTNNGRESKRKRNQGCGAATALYGSLAVGDRYGTDDGGFFRAENKAMVAGKMV